MEITNNSTLIITIGVLLISILIYIWRRPKSVDIRNKRILVTGAGSGVGLALTKNLATKFNCHVYACDINLDALQLHFANLENVTPIQLNVRDVKSVEAAAAKVTSDGKGLFGLVNCAGVLDYMGMTHGVVELSEEHMVKIIDTNLMGMCRMVKSMYPFLRESKGSIVNMGSLSGIFAMPFLGYYTASKFGVVGYTSALRTELKNVGIRVTCVEPGGINSPMLKFQYQYPSEDSPFAKHARFSKDGETRRKLSEYATSFFQTPEDVANRIVGALTSDPAPAHIVSDLFGLRHLFMVLPYLPQAIQDLVAPYL